MREAALEAAIWIDPKPDWPGGSGVGAELAVWACKQWTLSINGLALAQISNCPSYKKPVTVQLG
jgi:hypothetical protein